MGYFILFAIAMGIIGFIFENLTAILWIIGTIVGTLLLIFIYRLIPKKRYAKYLGTDVSCRTVGKRNASITITPNYNGTSYSGSIDYGDPGDTIYSSIKSYKLTSGRIIRHREATWEDTDNICSTSGCEGYYGELTYSLFSCNFSPYKNQIKAKEKFERMEKTCIFSVSNTLNLIVYIALILFIFPPSFLEGKADIHGPLILVPVLYYGFFIPLILTLKYDSYNLLTSKLFLLIINISVCLLGYLTREINYFSSFENPIIPEILLYFILIEIIGFIIYLSCRSK